MVIRLFLKDSDGKGNPAERRWGDRLMDELDTLLFGGDVRKPLVGNLEGFDYVAGECRLFLSCPDADALVNRLAPWLKDLDWPGGFRVVKRYGEFVDPDAPEEYVDD